MTDIAFPTDTSAITPVDGDLLLIADASDSYNPAEVLVSALSTKIRWDIVVGDIPTAIPATSIADWSISNSEFQFINGLSSNAQDQIDGKADSSHTHVTSDITSGTFANARIAESNVTQHQAALSITESQISDLWTYQPLDTQLTSLSWLSYSGNALLTIRVNAGETWFELSSAGTWDVTAASSFWTDNVLVKSDGTGKGVQATGISIADTTNDVTGMGNVGATWATLSWLTASTILSADASKNITSLSTTTYPSLTELSFVKWLTSSVQTQINTINSSLWWLTDAVVLKWTWDASSWSFPWSGSAQAWWSYIVSIAGTVDSTSFAVNDRILAITDNASTSTFASNWHKLDYTDQVLSVNWSTWAVVLDPDDLDDTSTTNKFTTASDISKLAWIETGADVTDATNVAAAWAIMDGDFSSNWLMKRTWAWTYSVVTDNSTNRDTAYWRWDHAWAWYLTSATAASTYQPLDSDLTAIAWLTATSNNIIQSVSSTRASRTPTQVTATLDAMVGDSWSWGTKWLVPAPAAWDAAASKFLKADWTWSVPAWSGDVSKVGTPVDGQIGVWTGDGTIEWTALFTRDNATKKFVLWVEATTTVIQGIGATTADTDGWKLYISWWDWNWTGASWGVLISNNTSSWAFLEILDDSTTLYRADWSFVFGNSTKNSTLDFSNIATTNKTFTFPNADWTVLLDGDIGSSVQAWDANLDTLSSAFTTASASWAASLAFAEDTDNWSNTATLIWPASIASNITITLPAATGTLATLAWTETFTNKTFDANGTWNALSNVEVADLASSAVAVASDLNTWTSTSKLVTPDALAWSNYWIEYFQLAVFDWTTDVSTWDGKYYFHIPPKLNWRNLVYGHARVITAGTTNTTDIQIHNVTDAVDVLTTKITIDSTETWSDTAATPYSINTSNDDAATNDLRRVDVDAVSTTAPKWLIVTLWFQLP